MPSEAELEFSTGIYRCHDICSLQIRVHLKTIRSSSVPLSGLQEDVQDDKLEELVLSWQQRVFSPWEIKFYSDINNCKSELHKEYNRKVSEITDDENFNKNIIFSYTSQDSVTKLEKDVLHHGYETSSFLYEAMQMKSLPSQPEAHSKDVPKHNIVDFNPSLQTILNNHVLSTKQESMYIMADIGYLMDGEVNEQVLVTIKWEPSLQVLTVFPDFNDSISGPGYTLEGLSDACCQYLFWVTYSKPEGKALVDNSEESKSDKQKFPLLDVTLPRHGSLDIHFFGEIKSSQHFENDNLFINYYFELPDGWKSSSGDLFGVTHRSKNNNGSCIFNHLFELHLTLNISAYEKHKSYRKNSELFPQLLLEVISMDSWGRVCREGCGWVRLIPTPGYHSFVVYTWRPDTNNSRINTMRRFFIGATSHVADRTYFGIPNTFNGKNLSKFGFGSISSGKVNMVVNVVLQSQDSSRLSSRMFLLERLSTTSLMQSVNNALKAFSLARQRLLRVSLPVASN